MRERGTDRAILALLGAAFLLGSAPAAAELVVFENGRHVQVSRFEVTDEDLHLTLRGGGEMTVPLELVERIVDDELDPEPPAPAPAPEAAVSPSRSVRRFAPVAAVKDVPYRALIESAAKTHRVDPALISAVIRFESNFSPRAISRKGARGLMQLMPATARRLGVRRSLEPAENIRGGTAYLSELAERFGESRPDLILAAYNAGERAVEEHGGIPPFRETRDYVRKVLALWNAFHARQAG